MSVFQYEILNNSVVNKRPYLDDRGVFIVYNPRRRYKYFLEARRYNPNTDSYQYYILLGVDKFDDKCYRCRVDDFGRLQLRFSANVKRVIANAVENGQDLAFDFVAEDDGFDAWKLL